MKLLITPLAAPLILLATCSPVMAELVCLPRDVMVERLANRYAEMQIGAGLVNGNAVVELFASETGTWTLIGTTSEGESCGLASGTDWIEGDKVALEGDPT